MGKTTGKTIAEQLDPITELAGQVAIKTMQQADAIDASIDPHGKAELSQAITADLIEDRVTALCMAANHVFFDPELRQEGDNGYFYALDYDGWDSRDDGAQPTGREVTVDRLQFLDGANVRGIVSNFDYQLQQMVQRSDKLRQAIRRDLAFGQARGVDVTSDVEAKVVRLERSVEQESMLKIAFNRACECYHSITGKVYETKDERAAAQKAAAAKAGADPRLAKLGV